MVNFYYGKGICNINGDVGSLVIYYRGKIVIESKLPDGYQIELEYGKLSISPSSKTKNLNELFRYLGEFRVSSVTANNIDGNRESVKINRVMDYSELLDTNSEDLTVKSENLKSSYIHGITFKKTVILPKGVKAGRY